MGARKRIKGAIPLAAHRTTAARLSERRGRRAAAVTFHSRRTHFGGQKGQMLAQNIPASDFNSWMQRQECGWGGEHGFVDVLHLEIPELLSSGGLHTRLRPWVRSSAQLSSSSHLAPNGGMRGVRSLRIPKSKHLALLSVRLLHVPIVAV